MKRTLIEELHPSLDGKRMRICGWAETVRNQKRMQFIIIRDHTGKVQASLDKEQNPTLAGIVANLSQESAIEVHGTLVFSSAIRFGGKEIVINSVAVANQAEAPLPLGPTSPSEDRLDWRFLDLRDPRNLLIFQVQTTAEHAMRSFWKMEGFVEIHSPKFMASPSESGAELFRVEYFDRHAYLAQSPQFYKQMAMAAGFDRIFEIGPVFRANPSFTTRHDTEFTSIDVEISWIESHEDIMQLEERWLRYILEEIKAVHGEEIQKVFGVEIKLPELPFPRITMAEAYELLEGMGHCIERGEKGDLDPQGERLLFERFYRETGHEFVFVTEYPAAVRAFYHMRPDHDLSLTKSFDLIWKGVEVTTGAQREHRYERLLAQAVQKGISPESIQYYLDFFRYGCPPHGGYGFGLSRMLMLMLGLKNVREVTYLYRGVTRLTP